MIFWAPKPELPLTPEYLNSLLGEEIYLVLIGNSTSIQGVLDEIQSTKNADGEWECVSLTLRPQKMIPLKSIRTITKGFPMP